jgi:hypothetical protein
VTRRTADRIEQTFADAFWGDLDMLRGDEPWPATPEERDQVEAERRLPKGCFDPLFDLLGSMIAEEAIDPRLDSFVGLLTPAEVLEAAALLEVDPPTCLLCQ